MRRRYKLLKFFAFVSLIMEYLIVFSFVKPIFGTLSYCSNFNTGTYKLSSEYQSNGLCQDNCVGYAFAIVNDDDCYCSNFMPSEVVDLSDCYIECSGYPIEYCGGEDYYGYIELGEASGTITESESVIETYSSELTSSTIIPTSLSTLTSSSLLTSYDSTPTSSSTSSTIESPSSLPEIPTTSSLVSASTSLNVITSVIYSVHTVTADQSTHYVTSQISTTILASETSSAVNKSGFFQSKGKVAGVFTVVAIVGLVLLCLLVFMIFRCVRHKNDEELDNESVTVKGTPIQKQKFDINEEELSDESFGTPVIDNNGDSTYIDQRLDVHKFHEDDIMSLGDHQDYTRKVLRIRNP